MNTQFKLDFAEWEIRMIHLEDCPQSEVEEIKNTIRECWNDPELRAYWKWRVADEAELSRTLRNMGKGITERIRQQQEGKVADAIAGKAA